LKKTLVSQEKRIAWIMITPALIVLGFVNLYPLLRNFWLSFRDYQLIFINNQHFTGFQNYQKIFNDPQAIQALAFTLKFTVYTVSLELIIGFAFALLMNANWRGRGLLRAIVLVPWAIPTTVSALMWKFMFDSRYGFVNELLFKIGLISNNITWLSSKATVIFALVITDVWKTTPFVALLLTAGIQMIPHDIYEAAKIDGANNIRSFFSITVPMLKSTILVTLLFRTMSSFNVFDIINVMTGGAFNTSSISIYVYKNLMSYLNFGYGSALAVIQFLFVFAIAMIYYRYINRADD
jgi:ABC-type sugar transport system permease subunit